jgi:hypothetical protein
MQSGNSIMSKKWRVRFHWVAGRYRDCFVNARNKAEAISIAAAAVPLQPIERITVSLVVIELI